MKFGTTFSSHWDGDLPQSEIYRQTVSRMVQSERLGYWSAWVTEHHFGNDADYKPFGWDGQLRAYDMTVDPLTLLSHVAALTSRIRLGTGVLVLHYDHPLRVAERAAMLDVLSGGRLELGLGRGSGFREPPVFGVPTDKDASKRKFREEIEILLKAWAGKPFAYAGEFFNFHEIEVVPHPLQKPHIPLYLGVGDPVSLKLAADHRLSYATTAGAWGWGSMDRSLAAHKVFEDAAAAAGYDISDALYPDTLFSFCAETDAEAEEMAEEHLMRFSFHVEAHYQRQRNGMAALSVFAPSNSGDQPKDAGVDDIRKLARSQFESNLIGSPKTICEKVAALKERLPFLNYILAVSDAGAPPAAFVDKSMALLAREVLPKFPDSAAVRPAA